MYYRVDISFCSLVHDKMALAEFLCVIRLNLIVYATFDA